MLLKKFDEKQGSLKQIGREAIAESVAWDCRSPL